jgi:hypothetical protein
MSATFGRRECPICGCEFEALTSNAVYCPPSEAQRQRQANPRSRCARRALNAKQRGQELTAPLPAPFVCVRCGRHCVPGRDGVDEKATKFCCRQHKAKWHREASRAA